jgi:hypothetical protein
MGALFRPCQYGKRTENCKKWGRVDELCAKVKRGKVAPITGVNYT